MFSIPPLNPSRCLFMASRRVFTGASLLKVCLVVFAFAWGFVPLLALSADLALARFVHRYWSTRNGLPNNAVQGITQSQQGFIWLATQEGMIRFDGRTFHKIDSSSSDLLQLGDIRSVYRNPRGQIWWGTQSDGLILMDESGDLVKPLQDQALDHFPVVSLLDRTENQMWVGTQGNGLFHQVGDRLEPVPQFEPRSIIDMAVDAAGRVWMATDGQGLWLWENGRFAPYPAPHLGSTINELLWDGLGNLWIATQTKGLWVKNDQGEHQIRFDRQDAGQTSVQSLLMDRDGILWFGTANGLGRLIEGVGRVETRIHGQELGMVTDFFEDDQGRIWVGTLSGGMHSFARPLFKNYSQPREGLSDMVWTVLAQDQRLWVMFDELGIEWLDMAAGQFEKVPEILGQQLFLSAAIDPQGQVYLGTYRGLYRWDGSRLERLLGPSAEREAQIKGYAHPVYCDRKGRIWIGQEGGLGCLDGGDYHLYREQGMGSATVQAFAEARDGSLWIASDKGLFRFGSGGLSYFNLEDRGLRGQDVLSVFVDASNRVWLTVTGEGLILFDPDQMWPIGVPEFKGQSLFGVALDRQQNFWIPSNDGVFFLSREHLDLALRDALPERSIQLFGKADGFRRAECNHGGYPAFTKMADGRMAFSTTGGVATVDPQEREAYVASWQPPKISVDRIECDGRSKPWSEALHLQEGFHDLVFGFSVIELQAPESLRVFTRLAGHDEAWEAVDKHGRMYYTSLPAGRYVFEVKAFGRGSLESTLNLPVEVKPVWFRRPLVLIGFLLLLSLLPGLIWSRWLWRRHLHFQSQEARRLKLYGELDEAHARLARAKHQIAEVGAQASQNEVVTHLLHNMGNVLNSVSVSAGVIEKLLRGTGVYALLSRIYSLFPEDAAERVQFVQQSPKVPLLPNAFGQIAELLDEHHQSLFDEVANLQVQSAHLKELVLSVSEIQKPIFELFDINILIEDAVKMQSHSLRKYQVEVEHDLMPLPAVRAKKSQILQILVNLIKNAYEAILESSQSGVRLISILTYRQDDFVVIEVNDNGPGISDEHMARLFGHGFTTKSSGHGFGLHFCRKVLREMEGDLTVAGQGPLGGASFKIWLRS